MKEQKAATTAGTCAAAAARKQGFGGKTEMGVQVSLRQGKNRQKKSNCGKGDRGRESRKKNRWAPDQE